MLQRIQSVYLLLAAVAVFALFALAFVNVNGATQSVEAFQDGDFDINDNVALLGIAVASGLVALINIFLFNNRKLQMRIGSLIVLLNVVLVGLAAFFLYQSMQEAEVEIAANAGFAMPALAIIFTLLANRNIKKDENLVKSAYSRLR